MYNREEALEALLHYEWSKVPAHLFNDTGKWKYAVTLDYTDLLQMDESQDSPALSPAGVHWDGHGMARRALAQATGSGTSGVTIKEVHPGWTLVVIDPPQGYPHLVRHPDTPLRES